MNKIKNNQNKNLHLISIMAVIVIAIISSAGGYGVAYSKYKKTSKPTENIPGYITADSARGQVDNFYQQYIHPKKENPEQARNVYVSQYGSKNLAFYKAYYQHGFDPIVCSAAMPTQVVAINVEPGPGAVVKARATYPDGSTADITLTLVMNNEGFKIDTITCPGDKNNIPPHQ